MSIKALNQTLFLHMNADTATAAGQLKIVAVIADKLIYGIPFLLSFIWFWGSAEQRSLALKSCAVAGIALAVNQLLTVVWFHPRPAMIGPGHTLVRMRPTHLFRVTMQPCLRLLGSPSSSAAFARKLVGAR